MKELNIKIKLFSYDELKGIAKERAFNEHKSFLDSLGEEYENENGEMINEFIEHKKEEVEESLSINEYLFFSDGEMADIYHFTRKHEKAGTTEFYLKGQIYTLN